VFGHRQAIDDGSVYLSLFLCSSYRVYKGRNLGKKHGITGGAIGNSLGNPMEESFIGNLVRTRCEHQNPEIF
jgi:hypothetical protein